jgi:hypothetical protein
LQLRLPEVHWGPRDLHACVSCFICIPWGGTPHPFSVATTHPFSWNWRPALLHAIRFNPTDALVRSFCRQKQDVPVTDVQINEDTNIMVIRRAFYLLMKEWKKERESTLATGVFICIVNEENSSLKCRILLLVIVDKYNHNISVCRGTKRSQLSL